MGKYLIHQYLFIWLPCMIFTAWAILTHNGGLMFCSLAGPLWITAIGIIGPVGFLWFKITEIIANKIGRQKRLVKVTTLSFSGGVQSTGILEMILNGDIKIEVPFLVLNADPGMENSTTYSVVTALEMKCIKAGITFIRVKRNLFQEILDLKRDVAAGLKKRFDTPPFWTRDRITGKRGRLKQTCSKAYKIAPMDHAVRIWMDENLGISRKSKRLGKHIVKKMIGFSYDEQRRVDELKGTGRVYSFFSYPLIEMKMKKADVIAYFLKRGLALPQRSVCNACYANNTAHLKAMAEERPEDFKQAIMIDNEIRDLTCIGVEDECFVSWTLLPLEELAKDWDRGFKLEQEARNKKDVLAVAADCQTGFCFR